MRATRPCSVISALLLSLIAGNSLPSAFGQTPQERFIPAPVRPGELPGSNAPPVLPGSTAVPYECIQGTCSCSSLKDCGSMGSDHICKEGTFTAGPGNTGSCKEKPPG
jgi:hypothetical protein